MQGPINSFGNKLCSYLLFNADCIAVPVHFYADVTTVQIGGSWRFDGHLLEYLLGPLFLQCVASLLEKCKKLSQLFAL